MLNVLALRDWPALRQWIQVVAAALLAALAANQIVAGEVADAILIFIAGVLPQAISALNTPDGKRAFLYGLVGSVQTLLIAVDLFTAYQIAPWANLALAALGGGVAVTHTPTPAAAQKVASAFTPPSI